MKKYIIANWKCHKSTKDARKWLSDFAALYRPAPGLRIIVAPTVLSLESLADHVRGLGIESFHLAAQDVSPFPKGSYTGAIAADMLRGLVDYVIIGHSERRRYFHETSQDVANKMSELIEAELIPIICVDQPYAMSQLTVLNDIESEDHIIAYGPVDAVTSRIPESPEKASETAAFISQIHPNRPIVYGGSLEPDIVKNYIHIPHISGLFIGQASLEVESFASICNQVAEFQQTNRSK